MSEKKFSNNKNSIVDSEIKAGGNVHIGDIHYHQAKPENDQVEKGGDSLDSEALKKLIAKNRIKEVLDTLEAYTNKKDKNLNMEIIAQQRKWTDLKSKSRMGVISNEEAGMIQNRICFALLNIIDDLA